MPASTRKPPPAALPDPAAPQTGWAWGLLAALAFYLALWGLAPLVSLGPINDRGDRLRRFELLVRLLYPEDLLRLWFEGFTLRGVWDRVPIVALAALVVVGATGLGQLAMDRLPRVAWLTRAERLVLAATVGLSLVSLATLLLAWGAAPAVQSAGLWLLLAVGAAATFVEPWRDRRRGRPAGATFWTKLDLLLVPPAAILLLGGMLPPTDFDVREYHLQAPREFFQRGGIEFLPHNVYANMPLGAEMYALAAMRMTGDWRLGALAGKLVVATFPMLTALALKAAGARWVTPAAGSAAAILYVSTPWVLGVSLNGLIEAALAHYLLATVVLAAAARGEAHQARERWTLLALSGFTAGAAAATKYPGALFGVVIPAVGIGLLARGGRLRALLAFVVCAAIGGGPWYVKNLVLAGNPTYPLLYEAFGGEGRTPEDHARWQRAHRPDNYSARDFVGRVVDFAGRSEFHSPLLAPLALVGLLDERRRRGALLLVSYVAAVFVAWWLLTHRIDRFWVPALPVVALLSGLGAQWLADRLRAPILVALLAAATAWGCLVAAGGVMAYNRFGADLQTCWRDPLRVPEWIARLTRETPPGKHVLSEGDAAVFDLPPRSVYHTAFDRSPLADLVERLGAEEARRAMAERQIALVYVNWAEIARYRQPGNYGFDARVTPELLSRLVREGVLAEPWTEYRSRGVEIYPVVPPGEGASTMP